MVKWLLAASVAWPMLLGAAVWQRTAGHPASWTTAVYVAASRICHQRPERSFATDGVQWPVCGRCSGLYLAAPFGAVFAARRRLFRARVRWWVAVASLPTAATLAIEWTGLAPVSTLDRAVAAIPLGAMIAAAIVGVVADSRADAIR